MVQYSTDLVFIVGLIFYKYESLNEVTFSRSDNLNETGRGVVVQRLDI